MRAIQATTVSGGFSVDISSTAPSLLNPRSFIVVAKVEPTEKAVDIMRNFSDQYARRSGTYFCVGKGVTSMFIKGLAGHKGTLGAPLWPCRFESYPSARDEQNRLRISASSKKSRVSTRAKNNDELVRGIRDFLSSVGIPDDHVPSIKVLSEHGRIDLAHKVRRRGYKFIAQLLEASLKEVSGDMATTDSSQSEMLGVFAGVGTYKEKPNASTEKYENLKLKDQISFGSPCLEEAVAKFIDHGELDSLGELTIKENGAHQNKNMSTRLEKMNRNGSIEHEISENMSSGELSCIMDIEGRFDNKDLVVEHHKDLDLIDLKQQIEKEKLVLFGLQVEAKTAIEKAQELVAQKEMELLDVEENLTGLVETIVQFSVEGEIVELAGSFNGWCNKINMEAEQTPTRMRRVWRTVLWLYPGVYEVKFVVDGNWTTDPEREFVTRNNIHNNVLRIY